MRLVASQVILIGSILAFALYVIRLRTVLTDRIIYLVLIGSGLVFVLHPELATRVANLVGIGRGADLVLYCFVIFGLFQFASIASGIKQLERQTTALVRALALDRPVHGDSAPNQSWGAAGASTQTD